MEQPDDDAWVERLRRKVTEREPGAGTAAHTSARTGRAPHLDRPPPREGVSPATEGVRALDQRLAAIEARLDALAAAHDDLVDRVAAGVVARLDARWGGATAAPQPADPSRPH